MTDHTRIADVLAAWAADTPDATAIVCADRRVTYAALNASVDDRAKALIAAGIDRGDRVAVLATTRLEAFELFYALCRIGATWVGLNPRHTIDELRFVVEDSAPMALIGMAGFESRHYTDELTQLATVPSVRKRIAMTGEIDGFTPWTNFVASAASVADAALQARIDATNGEDPACVVYTSGSTGPPKGALLPQRGLLAVQQAMASTYPVHDFSAVVNFPMDHVGGLTDIALLGLVQGGKVVLMERYSATATLDLLERERATLMFQTVGQVLDLASQPDFADRDLSHISCIIWGGEPVTAEIIDAWRPVTDNQLCAYGLTESCGAMTVTPPGTDPAGIAGLIGQAIPRVAVAVVDDAGEPAEPGEPGEIVMRGPTMMLGYLNRPDATAEAIDADGWLHTGDLAVQHADGNLAFVGRIKEMFKSGGYNVYPREIEAVLEAHPAVATAAVVAAPHPRFVKVGCAFVVTDGDTSVDDIEAHCRKRLANYKIPKAIQRCDALPVLGSGKPDKAQLADTARDLFAAGQLTKEEL